MRWVIVTDHPRRPSPYFSQLAAAAEEEGFGIEFSADVANLSGPPGILNLHRLKRLYRSSAGAATTAAALRLAGSLSRLKRRGWRLVWTLHNLYPIDIRRRRLADLIAARAVAGLADAVVCHTETDAGWMRRFAGSRTPVVVAGWGGLPTGAGAAAPEVERVARRMEADPWSFLLFGNLAPYKNVPGTVTAFLESGVPGRLHVVGPAHASLGSRLRDLASDRVSWSIGRVDPADAWRLYAAARAAVCPYRAAGGQRFFRHAIFASSVATAVAFDVPVVAPRLPSVLEMIGDRPAATYGNAREMALAFEAAAALPDTRGRRRPEADGRRWREVVRRYTALARRLSEDVGVVTA